MIRFFKRPVSGSSVIVLLFTGIILGFSWMPSYAGESARISGFSIKGIRLGMSANEVKMALPSARLHENTDFNKNGGITRFAGCAGMGCMMITDWKMSFFITDEPFGHGAYFIHYNKLFNGQVNAGQYSKALKQKLLVRYGRPTCETERPNNGYFACWGSGCRKLCGPMASFWNFRDSSAIYKYLKDGTVSPGKYLVVSFSNSIMQDMYITLFDTAPYEKILAGKRKEERRKIQRGLDF